MYLSSVARNPIRNRRLKPQLNQPTMIHKSPRHSITSNISNSYNNNNNALISDEENTSEYSHPPSSQHSTLESNPDMVQKVLKHNKRHLKTASGSKRFKDDDLDLDLSSSDDEINNNDEIEDSDVEVDSPNLSTIIPSNSDIKVNS